MLTAPPLFLFPFAEGVEEQLLLWAASQTRSWEGDTLHRPAQLPEHLPTLLGVSQGGDLGLPRPGGAWHREAASCPGDDWTLFRVDSVPVRKQLWRVLCTHCIVWQACLRAHKNPLAGTPIWHPPGSISLGQKKVKMGLFKGP